VKIGKRIDDGFVLKRRRLADVQEANRGKIERKLERKREAAERARKGIQEGLEAAREISRSEIAIRQKSDRAEFAARGVVSGRKIAAKERRNRRARYRRLKRAALQNHESKADGPSSPFDPSGRPIERCPIVTLSPNETSRERESYEPRRRVRCSALVLTDNERRAAHWLIEKGERCGHMGAILQRPSKAEGFKEILALRLGCKARSCQRCMTKIRKRMESRVKGPWDQFLTLGVPSSEVGIRDAWALIHGAIKKFTHALRDALRDESSSVRVKGGGRLQYAWCIEAHLSGWPHVHMVHNLTWLERQWAIDAWARATGTGIRGIHQEKIRDPSSGSRYLCKYVAKANLSIDILCRLKGMRLMSSTIRRTIEETVPWQLVATSESVKIESEIRGESESLRNAGGTVVHQASEAYALWIVPNGTVVIAGKELRDVGDKPEKEKKQDGRALRQAAEWEWDVREWYRVVAKPGAFQKWYGN
jgi:hypothetical protein